MPKVEVESRRTPGKCRSGARIKITINSMLKPGAIRGASIRFFDIEVEQDIDITI